MARNRTTEAADRPTVRRRKRAVGPVRALVGALPWLLGGCGGTEGVVSEGEYLYQANCLPCHGALGLGDGPMAAGLPVAPPSLLEHLGHHPMEQLVSIIRTGVPPAMPPAPLTEEETRLVIDYAWTLVPDSLVDGLREMQRMAEMGMEMGMDPMETEGAEPDPPSPDSTSR